MKNNLQEQAMAEISSSTVRNSVLFLIDSSFFKKKQTQPDIVFGVIVQLSLLSFLQQAQLLSYV